MEVTMGVTTEDTMGVIMGVSIAMESERQLASP